MFRNPFGILLASALTLSGCFNNISGTGLGSKVGTQTTALLNDTGFANETGTIDTTAVLIGTYRDTTNVNTYGIMVDLQKSLLATLGAASLQAILDGIDTNTAMQARSVVIHFPSFGIKATTTLGKIAANNGKKVRNIMNIRPGLNRIDLTTSALEVPASPSVLQLKNSNKTVVTYGGRIEGDYLRRMTVLIPFAGVNAGFLPSTSNAQYGDGYPGASPEEYANSVKLVRVTAAIKDDFNRILTKPPYADGINSAIQSDAIKTISQTYESLALAIHYKRDPVSMLPTTEVEAAYFININPNNTAGPETFPFCHSGYNNEDRVFYYNTNGTADYSHPLACNCSAAQYTNGMPDPNTFQDPCPGYTTSTRTTLLANAVAATNPAPTFGPLSIVTPITLNDFVLAPE